MQDGDLVMKVLFRRIASPALASLLAIAAHAVPPVDDAGGTAATNLADRICASYDTILSVSCGIRRTTGDMRMLSRVYFRRPDCVNVENIQPVKRRIVADGKSLYYHESGAPRGFSLPVERLTGEWLASLRNVPGTPMKQLSVLRGAAEEPLPPTDAHPLRRRYRTEQAVAVLSCDKENRPCRIDFFRPADGATPMASYEYSEFAKAGDSAWIPQTQKATIHLPDGQSLVEMTRVEDLTINQPISDALFVADTYFRGVVFTDDFHKTREP